MITPHIPPRKPPQQSEDTAKTAGRFRFSHLALLCLLIAVVAKIIGFSSADIRRDAKERAVSPHETLSPEQ